MGFTLQSVKCTNPKCLMLYRTSTPDAPCDYCKGKLEKISNADASQLMKASFRERYPDDYRC